MAKNHPIKYKGISGKAIFVFCVSLLVFALLFSSVIGLLKKHRAIKGRIIGLREEKVSLKSKLASMQELNNRIETDEGKEYILRDKFRMVRSGEGLIVVTEEGGSLLDQEGKSTMFSRFWQAVRSVFGDKGAE